MTTHDEARAILRRSFAAAGRSPTAGALQIAQAIALGETGYGQRWKNAGVGSHNWGAVQLTSCPKCEWTHDRQQCCWPCPIGSFESGDADAAGSGYQACFLRYPSDQAGADHFVRVLLRSEATWKALQDNDAEATARAMRAARYMETDATKYASGIRYNQAIIAAALGEPIFRPSPPSMLPALAAVAVVGAVIWWRRELFQGL